MATPAILTFPSNLAPVVPAFAGNGSKVEHPDLQIVFWGPYWPGTGQLTVGGLMQAVRSIVTGPYLEGMKQYGYIGPVNVRNPIVNTGNPNFTYPAPGPNVSQVTTTLQAVFNLVDNLRSSNAMGDVTSNHDLIVLVFLDPSIPFPQVFNAAGGAQTTVFGEHSKYEATRFLAPAIRFAYGWVCTLPGVGLSAFDQATWTFSHELVEAISNPFPPSGWVQTSPAAAAGSGEIGDVCNNTSCVVDSIVVQPYWGIQQAACILPTESRHLSLNQTQTKHVAHDGPTQQATVNMGPLCGTGTFDYIERTWDNTVALTAVHPGYQVPRFTWSINGAVVSAGNSSIVVPATWTVAATSVNFTLVSDHINATEKMPLVPSGHQTILNPAASLASATLSVAAHPLAPGPDLPGGLPRSTEDPLHHNLATLRVTVFDSVMTVECGPGQGNVSFSVGCQAVENWDGNPGATVTTQLSTSTTVDMTNQEIVWGSAYQQAANDCYAKTHKAAGGTGIPGLPRNPGDPGPEGMVDKVQQLEQAQKLGQQQQVSQAVQAAQTLKNKLL
jgi:hypothetical protein